MPRLTNKYSLPDPLVRAVGFSNYDKGDADFSVTELVSPPRIAALRIKHDAELEEDASDRLWLLMGSAGHEVLRRSSNGGIVEERCMAEIAGRKVSGQLDYAVADKAIWDYKFVSVWALQDGVKPEWEQQLNGYCWLARQYGVEVNELAIIAIMRDWSKPESSRDRSYPQSQVRVLPVRIWENGRIEEWLQHRIEIHESARKGPLPECLPTEMWEKPEKYAIKKKGNIRATKLCDTKDEAFAYMAGMGSGYEIETRRAERPRCENYCPVSGYCEVFKAWKAQVAQ